jgi:small GTP-binding protein
MTQKELGIRLVLVGDTGVGKTSLIRRFLSHKFAETETSTVGAVYYTQDVMVAGEPVKLQIWDTAGQEQYRALGPIYYRNARAAIAVCDLSNPESIDGLNQWIDAYRAHADETFVVVAANKGDLVTGRELTDSVLDRFELLHAKGVVTSAQTGEGVDELFFAVAQHFLEEGGVQVGEMGPAAIEITSGTQGDGGCC